MFGTLRADIGETMTQNQSLVKRMEPSTESLTFSPPMMRVSILEQMNSQDEGAAKEEFEKVVAESELYLDLKTQIDDQKARIAVLEEENMRLNEQIERVKQSYQQEIDCLKDEQRLQLSDLQNLRKTMILRSDEAPASSLSLKEIEQLRNENLKLSCDLSEKRQIHENELSFLKEELERAEKKVAGYKANFDKIASDRDFYLQKLNHVMGYLKKKKAEKDQEKKEGLFGLRLSLFRR